jgi:porin
MFRIVRWASACCLAAAVLLAFPLERAQAAPPPISIPAAGENQESTGGGAFGFLNGINRSPQLLGDMWGLRTDLSKIGMTLAIQEVSEYLGNTQGGLKQGFEYDGVTEVLLQMDTMRAFRHYGGLFNVSYLNIHGQNLSADNLGTLQTSSGIEADDSTRLWEAWYDQKFLDEDRLDIKIGQQSLDQEFMVSTNALYFVNTMFGWPMLPSADLPGGGPAYPLSALGVRLSARPVNGFTVLAGVFNGDPVKKDDGTDSQKQNCCGTSFPTGDGYLSILELQFSYPALGSMVSPGQSQSLGWTYRIGAWYDSKNFADVRKDTSGASLADPDSNGNAKMHSGNFAYYAVADQLVWRDPIDPNRTIALFARVMQTPLDDRNLITASANAGVVMHSPFRYRTDDVLGVGWGYAQVSSQVSQLDRDTVSFSGMAMPIRSDEQFIEITYLYQLKPWIQLQPDFQYITNPGGGISDPVNPAHKVADEVVMGVRAIVSF